MGVYSWTDGRRRWLICSMLRHTMCSDGCCARIQTVGESWDKWCSEWEHSQRKCGKDYRVQVVWITRSFGD